MRSSSASLPYGIGITPDQAPTAAFTVSNNGLTVLFDGSGSSSPIGTIATYLWNFGDGAPCHDGFLPLHTYAKGWSVHGLPNRNQHRGTSTRPPLLGSRQQQRTALGRIIPNNSIILDSFPYGIGITPDQAPTAAFTTSVNGLTVSFDGSGSSSPVGTIATYLWDFGDGSEPVTT